MNSLNWNKVDIMAGKLSYRTVKETDLERICQFPQNEEELFFMFPKADYPLTSVELEAAIESRFDNTVILRDEEIAGFANFYEIEENFYSSIGNVIVNPFFRNQGVGEYLIKTMENIALRKYHVKEIHLSCFNFNTKGILLYTKLRYRPYDIEKWIDKESKQVALIKMKREI